MSETKFRKLAPVRIFEQVVEQIRDLIMTGAFRPGEKLPAEQELEKELNVSRSSIREALRVLEYEGIVEVRRGSGTFVSPFSKQKKGRIEVAKWLEQREDTLRELLEVREFLEGLTASLAATHAGQEALDELGVVMQQIKEVIQLQPLDVDQLAVLDTQFHLGISRAAGNSLVNELINYVIPAFQVSNKAVLYIGDSLEQLLADHTAVLTAIKNRDSKAAERAMREHILRVKNEVQNLPESLSGTDDVKKSVS
jgi:GntR family transcriptional regulator, transcriptional repressor for pyruvate dehydrogenase complex